MGGFLSVCITENQFVAAIATVFVNFGSLKLILPEAATRGVLQKKFVLNNFAKFTGKHLSESLF